MSDTVSFEIQGLKELDKELSRIGETFQKKFAKSAARAAGQEYRRLVKPQIPEVGKDGTFLKKSIAIVSMKGDRRNEARVRVGIKGKSRYYAHLFEFGFQHVGGKIVPGTRVFTKTLQSNQVALLRAMRERLAKDLDSY